MSGPGLGRVADLFFAALEVAPSERAAFLDEACAGDASLRAEVERLVAADAATGSMFDAPMGEVFGRQRERAAPAPEPLPPPAVRLHLASFVGRERETGEILELLGENRLVTLLGGPGIGKSRLALHVAERAAEAFNGRIRFVDVAAIDEPEGLEGAVAAALGVHRDDGQSLGDAVRAELGRKRCLLILDGCERLAAACAPLAEGVLRAGARARILATSREALDVSGEAAFRVGSLALPEGDTGRVAEHESVRLFVERARLQKPSFALSSRTEPTIAAICRRLDGIPLAIELAAARVRTLPVEQILARLDDPFRLLVGGGRTSSPRHRSMRAAIDWSYDRLSPEEQSLFARLSAFEVPWSLGDAESVIGSNELKTGSDIHHSSFIIHHSEVLQHLERLVEKSLVVVERDDEVSYRMYAVLRAYAREKLERGN